MTPKVADTYRAVLKSQICETTLLYYQSNGLLVSQQITEPRDIFSLIYRNEKETKQSRGCGEHTGLSGVQAKCAAGG